MEQALLDQQMRSWLYEATHDVVGLWELCRVAREKGGARTPDESRKLVVGFVRDLLTNGVRAVNVADGHPWPDQRPDSVIERISREWDDLGREPNVPDIVWFKKTS